MRKHLVNELEVAVPADVLWAIYSTTEFPKLVVQLLPTIIQNIEIDGDGSLGTVLNVTFVPGVCECKFNLLFAEIECLTQKKKGSVPLSCKEKIVTMDHEKRLREVVQIEGGYLDLGCSFHMSSFQILEKGCDSCIIKSMVTYELAKDADPSVADLVTINGHAAIAQVISKYVLDKQGATGRGSIIELALAVP